MVQMTCDVIWPFFMLAYTALSVVACHYAYKSGVWDGAFNQFLPHVRLYMRDYDAQRAHEILGGDR
jgi:hypothetical protein